MESRRESKQRKNLGGYERLIFGLGGTALARAGLRRGPWTLGGLLLTAGGAVLAYRGASGYCPVYHRLGIDTTHEALRRGVTAERAITVARAPEEVYRFWRRLENLPAFMTHIRSLTVSDDDRSHWVAREGRFTLSWDAELVEDRPGERIAWRSLPGGDVDTEGMVAFAPAPGNRGTDVRLRVQLAPPAGHLTMMLAPLLRRITRMQIGQDLYRMKQLLETGEMATGAMRREAQPITEEHLAGQSREQPEVPLPHVGEAGSLPPTPAHSSSTETQPQSAAPGREEEAYP